MELIEQFICGKKGSLAECEDGIVITDFLLAVIDGATSKSDKRFMGKTGGAFAKDILSRELLQPGVENFSAEELFSVLSLAIKAQSEALYPNLSYEEYPRASVILYNRHYHEVWGYGDCQCMINGEVHTHEKAIDTLNSELRAFYLECELLNGNTIGSLLQKDVAREHNFEHMKRQFEFENRRSPFGYPVLNGFPIDPELIARYVVSERDEVVLSSDGYPELKGTLADSENKLKEVLEKDPLCFRMYKTTKGLVEGNISFDDRSYLRFRI